MPASPYRRKKTVEWRPASVGATEVSGVQSRQRELSEQLSAREEQCAALQRELSTVKQQAAAMQQELGNALQWANEARWEERAAMEAETARLRARLTRSTAEPHFGLSKPPPRGCMPGLDQSLERLFHHTPDTLPLGSLYRGKEEFRADHNRVPLVASQHGHAVGARPAWMETYDREHQHGREREEQKHQARAVPIRGARKAAEGPLIQPSSWPEVAYLKPLRHPIVVAGCRKRAWI